MEEVIIITIFAQPTRWQTILHNLRLKKFDPPINKIKIMPDKIIYDVDPNDPRVNISIGKDETNPLLEYYKSLNMMN